MSKYYRIGLFRIIKIFTICLLFFCFPILVGCSTITSAPNPNPLEPASTTMAKSQTPVTHGVFFPTPMKETGEPTNSPTPTITLKSFEVLEPAIAMKTVQPLLTQPLNCGSVPCFWGIIPGKTTLTEVRKFFGSLGLHSSEGVNSDSGKKYYSTTYDTSNGKTSGLTVYFDTFNIVEYMEVTPDIPTPTIGEPPDLGGLSPEMLIKMYGSPSKVNFAMALGQMSNILVDMTLYFDNSDVIANFHGYHMTPENFCPLSAPYDYARLWIGKNPQNTPPYETLPLEKVSTLNTEEFAQLLLGDPQKACFSLNVDMFK